MMDNYTNVRKYTTLMLTRRNYSIGQFKSSPTIIDVDSTVGFPNSGELEVIYSDQTIGVVSYTSKSFLSLKG